MSSRSACFWRRAMAEKKDGPDLVRLEFSGNDIANRTSSITKDAMGKNAYYEEEVDRIVKRPGTVLDTAFSACGSGLYSFDEKLIVVAGGSVKQLGAGSDFDSYELRVATAQYETAAGTTRFMSRALSYNGSLWVMGGEGQSTTRNDVWNSTDGGVTWTEKTSAAWPAGHRGQAACVHDGKMWVSGGFTSTTVDDVYSSLDGITWTTVRVSGAANGFGTRWKHTMVSYDGKLWVMGGERTGPTELNDVWYSVDGAVWTLATAAAAWSVRLFPEAVVHNNKMWLLCGLASATLKKDVWYSTDGVTWTQATADINASFAARSNVVAFTKNGYLYTGFGNTGGGSSVQDLWKSTDGITWTQVTGEDALWATVSGAPTGILHSDGALYIFMAVTGGSPDNSNRSVWRSTLNLGSETLGTITINCAVIDFDQIQSDPYNSMFLKTEIAAWTVTNGILTAVTDVDYPSETVPGVVTMDGYVFVMTPAAEIYNSDLEVPTSWNALNFLTAEMEPDSGVALAKHLNYVVALGQWTTEFFFDAANTTGSPLSRLESASMWVGCAAGRSVVNVGNMLIWVAKDRTKGRWVIGLDGLQVQKLSTPAIDRIITASTLATVRSFPVMLDGHLFYVLQLIDDGLTLVLDVGTKKWAVWSTLTAATAKSVVSITRNVEVATITVTAHGYAEGDTVTVAGATQTDYNGDFIIHNVATNTFDITVRNSPTTPATGTITAKNYTEGRFIGVFYAHHDGENFMQDSTTGDVYTLSSTAYRDNSAPIRVMARTNDHDFGAMLNKFVAYMELHADYEDSFVYCRYSDDDFRTYSKFRDKWLNGRVRFNRLGAMRKRSFEIAHVGNTAFRLKHLEFMPEMGDH